MKRVGTLFLLFALVVAPVQAADKPSWTRCQFTLRNFLLSVAVIGGGITWYKYESKQREETQLAWRTVGSNANTDSFDPAHSPGDTEAYAVFLAGGGFERRPEYRYGIPPALEYYPDLKAGQWYPFDDTAEFNAYMAYGLLEKQRWHSKFGHPWYLPLYRWRIESLEALMKTIFKRFEAESLNAKMPGTITTDLSAHELLTAMKSVELVPAETLESARLVVDPDDKPYGFGISQMDKRGQRFESSIEGVGDMALSRLRQKSPQWELALVKYLAQEDIQSTFIAQRKSRTDYGGGIWRTWVFGSEWYEQLSDKDKAAVLHHQWLFQSEFEKGAGELYYGDVRQMLAALFAKDLENDASIRHYGKPYGIALLKKIDAFVDKILNEEKP